MAHAKLGGGYALEFLYDRSNYSPSDNAFDVSTYSKNTTTNIINTEHPASAQKFVSFEIYNNWKADAVHNVNLSEDTNVYLSAVKYESTGATFNFNLGNNASLSVRGGDGLYHMLTSDENFNFNFNQDGPSTLKFEDLEFLPQDSYPNSPTITGLGPDDTLIVNGAKAAEFSNKHLIFKDDAGKVVLQLNAPRIDERYLSFGTDETGAMTVHYACYLKGTHIATPEGETKVEELKAGDIVLPVSGGTAKVKWVGYRILFNNRIPDKDAKRTFPI